MKKKAFTLNEIIAALTIVAMAIVPLWGLFSRRNAETLYNESKQYAAAAAEKILSAMLDNVPFALIKAGNPGVLTLNSKGRALEPVYNEAWLKKTALSLFKNAKKTPEGYLCRGVFKDERGITYTAHLKAEDICCFGAYSKPEAEKIGESYPNGAPTFFVERNELTFSHLKAPSALLSPSFTREYKQNERELPLVETDLPSEAAAPLNANLYEQKSAEALPFGYVNPTAFRYTQKSAARHAGLTEANGAICLMKRLTLQIEWNLAPSASANKSNLLFGPNEGKIHRLHLITLKADLDQ